ncbi:MAG TPA: hypothetical protein VGF84_20365 [Micromonosporaceae bacterium]
MLFEDGYLASLHDRLCTGSDDEPFYLDLIHSAPHVLGVGRGTATLLHRARAPGHPGDHHRRCRRLTSDQLG